MDIGDKDIKAGLKHQSIFIVYPYIFHRYGDWSYTASNYFCWERNIERVFPGRNAEHSFTRYV